MKNWKPETIDTLTLALCIAVFPPLWAVAAPCLNVNILTLGMAEGGYRSSYPLQIAVSMLAGVWYVGVFMGCVQKKLADMLGKKV